MFRWTAFFFLFFAFVFGFDLSRTHRCFAGLSSPCNPLRVRCCSRAFAIRLELQRLGLAVCFKKSIAREKGFRFVSEILLQAPQSGGTVSPDSGCPTGNFHSTTETNVEEMEPDLESWPADIPQNGPLVLSWDGPFYNTRRQLKTTTQHVRKVRLPISLHVVSLSPGPPSAPCLSIG